MRQAPFVSWITDLSEPDKLFHLPFTMPFLGEWFNILPLIMGVASFVQMKLTPKTTSGDDPQAKIAAENDADDAAHISCHTLQLPFRTYPVLDYQYDD